MSYMYGGDTRYMGRTFEGLKIILAFGLFPFT